MAKLFITDPIISVSVYPTSLQILDIVSHNYAMLNCTARAYVKGQSVVPLAISIFWTRQEKSLAEENVNPSNFETSGSPETGYKSKLNRRETVLGSVTYRCVASLNITKTFRESSQSIVTIFGKFVLCLWICVSLYQ